MNDPNSLINQVLSGLDATPTPTGLEQRVLLRLQTENSKPKTQSWTMALQTLAATPAFRIAAVSTAAIVLAATLATHHHSLASPATAPIQPPLLAGALTVPAPAAQTPRASRLHFPQDSQISAPAADPATVPAPAPLDPAAALALAETAAPSLPSPTLALTADERLIQVIVRGSDLQQFAELTPPKLPLPRIAPIFAGFASRQEADLQAPNADSEPSPNLDADTQ